MGPGWFGPDDNGLIETSLGVVLASMGPGWFGPDDNLHPSPAEMTAFYASMGPGWFGPDDRGAAVVKEPRVTTLQWGRAGLARMTGDTLVETEFGPKRFNGAGLVWPG